MRFGVWAGVMLVLATYSVRLAPNLSATVTWVLVWLAGGLVLLGMESPNVWVGLVLAWIGLQIPWTQLVHQWSGKQRVAPLFNIVAKQGGVILGGVMYITLARSGQGPAVLSALAMVALSWATFNAAAAGWSVSHGRKTAPGVYGNEPGWPIAAYVGSNHMLSWLCGLGLLSGLYLAAAQSPLWLLPMPLLVLGALLSRNITGVGAGLAGATAFIAALWGAWAWIFGILGAYLIFGWTWQHQGSQLTIRWHLWRSVREHYTWTGRGLGYFQSLGHTTPAVAAETEVWDHLHSEWLQALMELGPLPIICALAYLVLHWVWLPAGPHAAYSYGLLILTAGQALTYFPLHLPGQALPLLVAMAALDGG